MAYIGITSAQDSEQLSPNYIGFQPTFQRPESAFVVDTFVADGSQQVFPLSNPKPTTSRAVLVSVAGYSMVPVIDYDLDQYGNLEFITPPGSGNAITVHHLIFPKNEATTAIRKLDDISGNFNGTTTRFTLTANGVAANILGANVLVISINGVIQEPGEAYIMDGDDIIFSESPPSISSFYGIDVGTTGIGTPGDGTITSSKFITDNQASTGKVLGVNSAGDLSWVTVGGGVGATDLDGLSDVSLVLPMSGQVLRFNGSNFVNAKLNYNDLQGPPSLASVATSGNYNDLTNKPVYPTDLSGFTDSSGLLFDKDYASLTNLPSIPDHITEFLDIDIANPAFNQILVWDGNAWINDNLHLTDLGIEDGTAGQVLTTDGQGGFTFTTVSGSGGGSSFSGSYADLTNKPTLFSGSYTDLTNKPTIPSGQVNSDWNSSSGPSEILNKPTLFSGSYVDLTNKPTIPADVSDLTGTTLASSVTASSLTSVGTLSSLDVSGVSLLGGYSQVAGYYSELGVKYSGGFTQYGLTLQPTTDNTTAINFLNAAGTNIGSITQTASTVKFVGDGSQLSKVATQTTGSWTLAAGANTVSLTVPINGTYSIWVRGNIPNGIVTYTATAVVTNTNVPVIGSSYGWYYAAGNALVLTAIPTQFVGTVNTISNAVVSTTAANVFTFGITNNTGSSQVIDWGYTKL